MRPRSSFKPTNGRQSKPLSADRFIPALAALLSINALFLLPLWWRDGLFTAWLIPELWLLPVLIGAIPGRWWTWCLASLLGFLFLALSGDALVRDVLDRPLNLILDPLLLRAGFHFLSGSLGFGSAALIAIAATVLVGLIVWVLRRLIQTTDPLQSGTVGWMLSVASIGIILIGLEFNAAPALRPALVQLTISQTEEIQSTLEAGARLIERADSPRLKARAIPALADRDVIVVFVESYGISAWMQTQYRRVIEPLSANAKDALRAAGLEVMTTRLRSPIRGGQSWLAHASLLSGQRIDNDLAYRRILSSNQDFLSDDLAASGHHTIVVAPAIVRPWPEARELGFDHQYSATALDYLGPGAGWVGIPDQFTLHRFSQLRADHPAPSFSLLLLISSHAPWLPGPPLLDDWSRLNLGLPWPDWTPPPRDRLIYLRDSDRLRARYPESLAYSLEAVLAWAVRDLPPDALLLVMGDHQPAALITGKDTSQDVPVHLISADAERLSKPAGNFEFLPGFRPPSDPAVAGLEDLREWFRSRPDSLKTQSP